ncbi:MAG: hypothetical protein AAGJ82_07750 [Bacteroidota bacterium]
MKKSIISFWTLVLVAGLFFPGCDHDTDEFDGPGLVDRFGPLSITRDFTANPGTVDFSAGEVVVFDAAFNKNINFQIEITGLESGAVKRIEAFGNELTAENATWDGGTTSLPFFKTEMCEAKLIILEDETLNQTASVEITGTKIYEGGLFTGFEENISPHVFFGNFEFEFTASTGVVTGDGMAAEGDAYYFFEGTDDVVPNFFVGLVEYQPSLNGETYVTFPTTVPEELYFNCFIRGNGGPHVIAVVQFAYDTNDNGVFDDGTDALFQLQGDYPVDWTGWRHINHTMADMGMTEEDLSKIVTIRVLLISNMNTQPNPPVPVSFGLDFITFTAGQPLEL